MRQIPSGLCGWEITGHSDAAAGGGNEARKCASLDFDALVSSFNPKLDRCRISALYPRLSVHVQEVLPEEDFHFVEAILLSTAELLC